MLAGGLAIYLIWRIDVYRQKRKGDDPSPTPPPTPVSRETPQVTAVSSRPSHETDDDGEGDWYGRIARRGHHYVRVAKHVARTGETPPPDDNPETDIEPYDPPGECDIDLPLDGEQDQEPAPSRRVQRETRERYVRRCLRDGAPRAQIVAGLQEHYRMSRAQAYRLVGTQADRRAA